MTNGSSLPKPKQEMRSVVDVDEMSDIEIDELSDDDHVEAVEG